MDHSPPSLIRSPASSRTSVYSRSPSLGLESYTTTTDYETPFYKPDLYDHQQHHHYASMDATTTHSHHAHLDATTTSAEWVESLHAVPHMGMMSPDYVYANYDNNLQPTYHDPYATAAHLAHPPIIPSSRLPLPGMPRIKLENEYANSSSTSELSQYPSPQSTHALMAAESSSYSSRAGSVGYVSDAASSDFFYTSSPAAAPRIAARSRAPKRAARKLTSKEEANFQCEVEGCGKLFSRSYNYKAHMETHDKGREYPFACTFDESRCGKRFVRKTDLQRHVQSVHMKEKNHKCDYCGRMFARKDTLRRHMEDGCSKRFDIGTMDLRADAFDAFPVPVRTVPSSVPSSGHLLPRMTLPRDTSMISMSPYMRR